MATDPSASPEEAREEHHRLLELLYERAPVTRLYGSAIRVSHGASEVTLPADERFFHGAGAIHGSVYFRALDDAAFFAANSVVFDVLVLTTSFQLDFFRPVRSGTLRAIGSLLHAGRNRLVAGAELVDESGARLAMGTGTFMPSRFALRDLAKGG
jgi:uncharacterized protein (TIGR00369 family)